MLLEIHDTKERSHWVNPDRITCISPWQIKDQYIIRFGDLSEVAGLVIDGKQKGELCKRTNNK